MVLKEDLLLRFGAAKVMARPDQDDLALAGTYNLTEKPPVSAIPSWTRLRPPLSISAWNGI